MMHVTDPSSNFVSSYCALRAGGYDTSSPGDGRAMTEIRGERWQNPRGRRAPQVPGGSGALLRPPIGSRPKRPRKGGSLAARLPHAPPPHCARRVNGSTLLPTSGTSLLAPFLHFTIGRS